MKSKVKFQLILENANDLICVINQNYEHEYVNEPVYKQLLGYSNDDLIGKSVVDFTHPDHVEKTIIGLEKCLDIGEATIEIRIKKKDGPYIWFELKGKMFLYKNEDKKIVLIARDISEKKKSEQTLHKKLVKKVEERTKKLAESEEKYRLISESAHDFISVLNEKFKFEYVSEFPLLKILGYSSNDLLGKSPLKFSHPDDHKSVLKRFNNSTEVSAGSIETRIKHKDGYYIWCETSGKTFTGINGERKILLVTRDISERKRAQEKLKESEEKYRLISENANDLIVILNEKYEFEYFNEEVHQKLMGYSRNDLIGKSAIDLVHPDDIKIATEAIKRGIYSGEGTEEIRYKHKNGNWIWLHIKGKTFKGQDEKPKGLLISRDITKRKKAEQRLRESEKKYRKLFENTPEAIVLTDPGGIILEVNSAFEKTFGFTKKEVVGKPYYKFSIFNSDQIAIIKKRYEELLGGSEKKFEKFNVKKKDGSSFWILYQNTIIKLGNELYILTIAQDITEIEKAEKIIEEELIKLKELDEIKNKLITRASHELKTPLVSICGGSELLLDKFSEKFGKEELELIELIEKGGKRLKFLVDNLLDITRIEYNKLELEKELTEINEIIRHCVEEMMFLIRERDLILELNLLEDLNLKIDKIRIEQVILNLLSNAIKNTPTKGIITIKSYRKADWTEISVSDTGIGLTREEMDRIFTRFGKIERYGDGLEYIDIQGSGLGLFISKEIVDLHGGSIIAESEGRHKGSTFIVKLPLK